MKLTDAQKQKIRQSARGERCTMRIPGLCNGNPETTVWAHFPDESKGMGIKSFDLSGGYVCSAEHDWLDGRPLPVELRHFFVTEEEKQFFMRRAQTRTLKRLIEKGILIIK